MPEGDTVWLAANRLNQALAGKVLERAELRVPAHAAADLAGATVLEVVPRGKHILMRMTLPTTGQPASATDPPTALTLHSHLRMEGTWHLYPPGAQWRGGPTHTIRAVLAAPGVVAVGYRLGMLDLVPTSAETTVVGHLGPDVLAADFDRAAVLAALAADPERPVGEALLDQRVLAGLGTDYVSEVCFLTGLHPLTPVSEVDHAALVDRARTMIRANVGRASRTTTGRTGRGNSSWVHGRTTCLRCGTRLRRATVGAPTRQRELPWCPSCQGSPPTRSTRAQAGPQLE